MRRSLRDPAWLAAVTRRAWSPLDLAPDLWLDASDASTITDAGAGAVSEWRDKSGNARHMSQVTAARRPTTGVRTQNGRNVIDFVRASTQWLDAGDVMDLGLNGYTMFVVGGYDDTADSYMCGKAVAGSVNGRYGILRSASTSYSMYDIGATATGSAFVADVSLAVRVISARVARAGASSSNTIRHDGVTVATKTFTDVASSWDVTTPWHVGGLGTHDGPVGEVVFFLRTLSDGDRDLVEAYLKAKWGTA